MLLWEGFGDITNIYYESENRFCIIMYNLQSEAARTLSLLNKRTALLTFINAIILNRRMSKDDEVLARSIFAAFFVKAENTDEHLASWDRGTTWYNPDEANDEENCIKT